MEVGNWFDVSQNLLIQEEQGDMTPKGVVSCCIMLSESKNHEINSKSKYYIFTFCTCENFPLYDTRCL